MRKVIWVTLILIASVFIYRIAGNKGEKMLRVEDRSIKRNNVQQVNNTDQNAALKIDEAYTSLSLILGGMPFNTAGNQTVMNIFNERATKRHITATEKMWKTLEGNRLKSMRNWRTNALENINQSSGNLVYPFGGPDFLYAYTLFPNCDYYILTGSQSMGKLPQLSELDGKANTLNAYLGNVRNALRLFSQRGNFSARDMQKNLKQFGVLPVLSVLLARTDNHISKISYITLDKNGIYSEIKADSVAKSTNITGVMIDFLNVEKVRKQTLVYLKADLNQEAIQNTIEQYLKRFDHKITLVKTGDYMLHQKKYTTIKNALLNQSETIVQDDSGLPFSSFVQDNWNIALYGRYAGTPAAYKRFYQKDLRQQYRANQLKALPFSFGYLPQGANLLIAQRKN